MHIVEILSNFPPETFILEHLNALKSINGLRLTVFAPISKIDKKNNLGFNKIYTESNLSLLNRIVRKINNQPIRDYVKKKNLELLRRSKPNLIHFDFGWTAIKYYQIPTKLKIPFTLSLRGTDIMLLPLSNEVYKIKLAQVIRAAAGIHVVSEHVENELYSNFKVTCPVKIIRSPIDKEKWHTHEFAKPEFKIITIGRLHWVKDFVDLIYAFKKVNNRIPKSTLTIVGDGDEHLKLNYIAKKLELKEKVLFTKKLEPSEIKKLLSESNLFVCTSLSEGFPNALIEAVLARVPCIAPNHLSIDKVFNYDEIDYYDKFIHNNLSDSILMALSKHQSLLKHQTLLAQQKANKIFGIQQHAIGFQELFTEVMHNGKFN